MGKSPSMQYIALHLWQPSICRQTWGLLESHCGLRMDRGRNNRHDIYSKVAPREMPKTDYKPFHGLCQSRVGFWKFFPKFGCSTRFIAVLRQFHFGMLAKGQNYGQLSKPFSVTTGDSLAVYYHHQYSA